MSDLFFHLAYLGPGGPEFMVIMLVLLVMFGAKDAPRILRKLNEIINQFRDTADGFKREVMYGDLNQNPSEDASPDLTDEDLHGDYDYDAEEDYSGFGEDDGSDADVFDGVEDAFDGVEDAEGEDEVVVDDEEADDAPKA